MKFLLITGMSGAGKSKAMEIMEDMNYYCMDNLPPTLLSNFAELLYESEKPIKKIAVVVDLRAGEFFDHLFKGLEGLSEKGISYRILFLDASNKVLVRRYKELRRPHPLNPDGRIIEGIQKERELLYEVKRRADNIINTSQLTLGILKEEMANTYLDGDDSRSISISINSFGFKHGILLDGDLVFDVRFIPNPYYIPELKEHTGMDPSVRDYVFSWEQTNEFVDKLMDMLEFLIPHYTREGKTQLIVGIGCTGGVHRSVAISNKIGELLKANDHKVSVSHRDSSFK